MLPSQEHSISLIDSIVRYAGRTEPLSRRILRMILSRWRIGPFLTRLHLDALPRPYYALCVYYAAREARALGHSAVTVAELGVAGGNGLVCLCEHRKEIETLLGIKIHIVGFDLESGLPATGDPRDLLYYWQPGFYKMDRPALERRLAGQAELILGDVGKTTAGWQPRPAAPLGAVIFDLDLYSSTMESFGLLLKHNTLPRIYCYFDDIVLDPIAAMTDRIGVREAIRQFNAMIERQTLGDHLGQAYIFDSSPPQLWHRKIYAYHRLLHPDYNRFVRGDTGGGDLNLTA